MSEIELPPGIALNDPRPIAASARYTYEMPFAEEIEAPEPEDGVKAIFRESPDVKMEAGEETMRVWLEEGFLNPPSALLAFNDTLAIGAIKAIRDHGLRVPEDISVVSFDDIEMARYLTPALTSFSQPRYEMGRVATEMMMTLLSGGTPEKPDMFAGRLVKRGTVFHSI